MNTADINPLTLPSLPLLERRNLPNCPAVYFVMDSDRVLYIGKSINLAQRWLGHQRWYQLKAMGSKVRIAWLDCNDVNLLPKFEKALIQHFKPSLNERISTPVMGETKKAKVTFTCTFESKDYLSEWATSERRTVSNLVEGLIEDAIAARLAQQNEPPTSGTSGGKGRG